MSAEPSVIMSPFFTLSPTLTRIVRLREIEYSILSLLFVLSSMSGVMIIAFSLSVTFISEMVPLTETQLLDFLVFFSQRVLQL